MKEAVVSFNWGYGHEEENKEAVELRVCQDDGFIYIMLKCPDDSSNVAMINRHAAYGLARALLSTIKEIES